MILEVACFSFEDTLIAIEAGADRIELCKNRSAGGLTPAKGAVKDACFLLKVPVYLMIRPRAKNFCYTDQEVEIMKKKIREFKKLNCAGFVFGILNEKKQVDREKCEELVKLAAPKPCTFHRAFDEVPDWEKALEDVIACGFTRILTSGGPVGAHANTDTLQKLVKKAGQRIKIMPGGGIRSTNVQEIIKKTKCNEIHTGARHPKRHGIDMKEIEAIKALIK
ncbi:MAG TPA: copper homeostasis protein CutC [Bacteroidia bacterium]|jgi:copper homeostasis protein|nr:copper homeostasis protein CutC [Bacteroidia bacterium]